MLAFDLTSVQDAKENCRYPEAVAETLRLELSFIFPLGHVTELKVFEERISSVAVDKFGVVRKKYKLDHVLHQQTINRIPRLK